MDNIEGRPGLLRKHDRSDVSFTADIGDPGTPPIHADHDSGILVAIRPQRRFYVPLRVKFAVAVLFATMWMTFSIWVSQAWLRDLGAVTHPLFAIICLSFIAYVPGFMNAFMIVSLIQDRRPKQHVASFYPGVTILIAAYQEEGEIAQTLASIARDNYPGVLEVLLLDDGSTDRTVVVANEAIRNIVVPANVTIRVLAIPDNRGKAAALNSGLKAAQHDLIVTIDADTQLRSNSLTKIVERLLSDTSNTAAIAGAILLINPRDSLIAGMQEWDYFHGIAAVKRMQSMYHGTLVAQGAFSIYRREALTEVGGWSECVGEDIVLTWALLKQGYRTGYAEDAIAFTHAPTSLKQFARQRRRWARGLVEALKHHGRLLFKARLSTMFIWWNLLFLPMDLVFTFVFIPGVVAALMGHYWIAGPMTLLTLPLAALWNLIIYRIQQRMFREEKLKIRRNYVGLVFYVLFYALIMQPVSLWGYLTEMIGQKKKWGTK